ncbi:MAG: diaminobutyrate--2-oxoglutarate transaminase [Acidimicrobiales bacterium]
MNTFEQHESEVRSYIRSWPTVFDSAHGSTLVDADGRSYVDFFAGAGALNYGHNPEPLRDALIDHLSGNGIVHGLDMATTAKGRFIETFVERILEPRDLDYRLMFPGPTGTNAVESALKLARKVTGRDSVMSFTNAFHGMTLGSLSVTGNSMKRGGAGIPLSHSSPMPYAGFLSDDGTDSIALIEQFLDDGGSGMDKPAAAIVETIQAEGGINVGSAMWLRRLQELCRRHGMLLIIDDIQVGCGRTGPFFSWEDYGLDPDIVCLSKSISGFGLPMAVVLIRPEHDEWLPGEHNGTFRGNNAAFVTASKALDIWWSDDTLSRQVAAREQQLAGRLESLRVGHDAVFAERRGRGLIQGLRCHDADVAGEIIATSFEMGLVAETAGVEGEVVKVLPALTITGEELSTGLDILGDAVAKVTAGRGLA